MRKVNTSSSTEGTGRVSPLALVLSYWVLVECLVPDNQTGRNDMSIDYEKALEQARKAASKAKNGRVKIEGQEYLLSFSPSHWHYAVTDSQGNFVVNLNVKTLAKAKSDLRAWLQS